METMAAIAIMTAGGRPRPISLSTPIRRPTQLNISDADKLHHLELSDSYKSSFTSQGRTWPSLLSVMRHFVRHNFSGTVRVKVVAEFNALGDDLPLPAR